MANGKEDIRPLQAIPGDGQSEHEGWSGFIPKEKHSSQGSTADETPITKQQRGK